MNQPGVMSRTNVLHMEEVAVKLAGFQQATMRSCLLNLSILNNCDYIRIDNGRHPVCDHNGRSSLHGLLKGVLDQLLRFRIEGTCGLVEQKYRRILQDGSCDGDSLLLSS